MADGLTDLQAKKSVRVSLGRINHSLRSIHSFAHQSNPMILDLDQEKGERIATSSLLEIALTE
jgi:hypothetical protein